MSVRRSTAERVVRNGRAPGGRLLLSERKARMLLRTMLVDFPSIGPLGYLVDARINCECAQGFVYKGWKHSTGEFVTSSQVIEILRYEGYWLLNTLDMDWFVVVNFHPHGGRRSLYFLIDLFQSAEHLGTAYCWH